MNKRLITIIPALLLAYTGARYEQLQSWQEATMPSSIIGGIKGRTMPLLHTALRLDIDTALHAGQDLIGVKLDKAKCFDRIVPSITCALFLALGLPKGFVNIFAKMYRGFRRHLCYKGWMNPHHTTAANGVAQGCSLSLIAINVHTKVWIHMLECLPEITVKAYIDDAYLWTRIHNIALLSQAVQATRLWDMLIGQKLNDGKSIVWGTSTSARQAARDTFPEMKLALTFDALGTRIYTSNKNDCGLDDKTLQQVLASVECIGALPIPLKVKAALIGTKAIPTLTYGAHISCLPKAAIQRVQGAVVKALWKNRPIARSRWLVLAFHGQPHRTDPSLAKAYNCVLELFRFCFQIPMTVQKLCTLWEAGMKHKHSLVSCFAHACDTLGIQVDSQLRIRFHHSAPLQLGECAPRDIAPALQEIVCQCAYTRATSTTRKDFSPPTGLLDLHASTMFARKPTFATPEGPSSTIRFESVIVGCTLTRDRLAAAGWCDSNTCRFCGQTKESLYHLVHECSAYHNAASPPVLHELGPNFSLLGHVEHPFRLTAFRLLHSTARVDEAAVFDPVAPLQEVWTDGSVLWQESFWLTTATFAVIDQLGRALRVGRVQRWNLSSFVAELWAIWIAFSSSEAPVRIYCDNQAVVHNVRFLVQHGEVQPHWKCRDWWLAILELHQSRSQLHCSPLEAHWIPAHLFENVPNHQLCPVKAANAGTTVQHIIRNRDADHAARALAGRIAPVYPHMARAMQAAATLHQEWLVRLHAHLDTHAEVSVPPSLDIPATVDNFNIVDARRQFPKWDWTAVKALHSWKPKIPDKLAPPKRWRYAQAEWHEICRFARSLRWKIQAGTASSFCEIAVLFHAKGFRCEGDYESITMHSIVCKIRQAFQFFSKDVHVDAFPGDFNPRFVKSAGKVLPQSAIVGAVPFMEDDVLFSLAKALNAGAGRTIDSWRVPFCF